MKHYCIAEVGADLKKHLNEVNSIQFTDSTEKDEVIVTMNFPDKKGTQIFGMKISKSELKNMLEYLY